MLLLLLLTLLLIMPLLEAAAQLVEDVCTQVEWRK